MSSSNIVRPVSAAPTDRLALGIGWVRPAISGTPNPSGAMGKCALQCFCFEGSDE